MDKRAQAGLEYLMTYGWALVLIATVVGVLVFVVSTPANSFTFTSSSPTKLMVKAGAVSPNGEAEIVVTNVTGGKMAVKGVAAGGALFGGELNGRAISSITSSNPLEVPAGATLLFSEMKYGGAPGDFASLEISYTDFAGLTRQATITGSGSIEVSATPISSCQTITQPGVYFLEGDLESDVTCINITSDDVALNCRNHSITATITTSSIYGIYLSNSSNSLVANCVVDGFTINTYVNGGSNNTISNNTLRNAGGSIISTNCYLNTSSANSVVDNTLESGRSCLRAYLSNDNTIARNSASGCSYGVMVSSATGNVIKDNSLTGNSMYDIYLTTNTNGNILNTNSACSAVATNIHCYTNPTTLSGSGNSGALSPNCTGLTGTSVCP